MTPIQETELDMTGLEKGTMPSLTWKIHEEKAEPAKGIEAMVRSVTSSGTVLS